VSYRVLCSRSLKVWFATELFRISSSGACSANICSRLVDLKLVKLAVVKRSLRGQIPPPFTFCDPCFPSGASLLFCISKFCSITFIWSWGLEGGYLSLACILAVVDIIARVGDFVVFACPSPFCVCSMAICVPGL
jgi:hypothetical protein